MRGIRRGRVGFLKEFKDRCGWVGRFLHIGIIEQELAHRLVENPLTLKRDLFQALWYGRGIGIESRPAIASVAWPKASADHFMRVSLCLNRVRSGMRRCLFPVETSHCEIEGAPKEMNGADFAVKVGRKALKQRVSDSKNPPKAPGSVLVVAAVNRVQVTADGIGYLYRHVVNAHMYPECGKSGGILSKEFSDRPGAEFDLPNLPNTGATNDRM